MAFAVLSAFPGHADRLGPLLRWRSVARIMGGGGPVTGTPYGAWPSPITAELVAAAGTRIEAVRVDGDDIWWAEGRPSEGGRVVLVRRSADGTVADAVPAGRSVRTRVHEYGGGAWCVAGGVAWFVDWDDQRIWRLDPGAEPRPITPEPSRPAGLRYADLSPSPDRRWLVCVRESHEDDGEAANEAVAVPADGSGEVRPLVSSPDFVANPRVSPDGTRLAWIQWDHPNMPWDATELWVWDFRPHGGWAAGGPVAGGPGESVIQPEWTADGQLVALSDRTGWWNPYRFDPAGATDPVPLRPVDADIGGPPWVFGLSWYAQRPHGGGLACVVTRRGMDRLDDLDLPFTSIDTIRSAGPDTVVAVGAGPTTRPAPVRIDLGTGMVEELRPAPPEVGPEWIAGPEPIDFRTTGGRTAHALLYRPTNPEVTSFDDERPPLVVMSHGGPTSAARPILQLAVQFWTTRGLAVVDVNYGGSTGYGRAYRQQLQGAWGIVDVDDCVAAARYLADAGIVDGDRMVIRGGSAGGFTTLAALAFRDVFAAGASHYGVADLEALTRDTHKFESRYLDGLVGPYPDAIDIYRERSPIHHTDGFSCPLIVFQGTEDEVVPPSQAETIVEALRAKGLTVSYIPFEGEQHGFRRAENIIAALEAELAFYGEVLGFSPSFSTQ